MKKTLARIPKSAMLYVVFAIFMALSIAAKTDYYIDEIYSYGLSNSTGDGIDLVIEYDETYSPAFSAYEDYVTVQPDERFSYAHVWQNQENDIHPPLYYAILHTICSLFPNMYSRWFAGIINIAAGLATLFVLRRLISLLTDNAYIRTALSIGFIASGGILSISSYLRMYMMAMLWVTLLTYSLVGEILPVTPKHTCKLSGGESAHPRASWKFFLGTCLVTLAGGLTHYYFIVYAVLISLTFFIMMLAMRRFRDALFFVVTQLAAGICALLIFPAMRVHMFFTYRGEEAVENMKANLDFWHAIKVFFVTMGNQLFGGYIVLLCMLAFVVIALVMRYSKVATERVALGFDAAHGLSYLLILIPCVAYFLIVSRITFAQADRYVTPIYAVAFVALLCAVLTICRAYLPPKAFSFTAIALTALIMGGSYANAGWTYLYHDTDTLELIASAKSLSDCDCICVFRGSTSLLYSEFAEYSNYGSITFVPEDEFWSEGIGKWTTPDTIVLSFVNYDVNNEVNPYDVASQNGYTSCTFLGSFGYDNSYLLTR